MASNWRYSVTLLDDKALKSTLNFTAEFDNITLADEFGDAQTAAAALLTDLQAVSDATVYREQLTYIIGGSSALPGTDTDITDELAVVVFLTADSVAPEYAVVRIPAPDSALFESDGYTLDETNGDIQNYVANFADGAWEVSDGQHVVTANQNGISHGFWRSRAKSTAKKV